MLDGTVPSPVNPRFLEIVVVYQEIPRLSQMPTRRSSDSKPPFFCHRGGMLRLMFSIHCRYWEVQVDAGEMSQGWIFWYVWIRTVLTPITRFTRSSGRGRQSRRTNGATRKACRAAGSHKIHRKDYTRKYAVESSPC